MNLLHIAYLAGIIDGEGSISMSRQYRYGKDKLPYWRITLSVSSCDSKLINWLHEHFGGSIIANMYRGANRRLQHRWSVGGDDLRSFIKSIIPFLIIKKERAQWASEVLDIQNLRKQKAYSPYSDEEKIQLYKLRLKFDNDVNRSLSCKNRPTMEGEFKNGY